MGDASLQIHRGGTVGHDSLVFGLVARWEEARERGERVTVEQVCADAPELVGPVRDAIRQLHGGLADTSPLVAVGDRSTASPNAGDLPQPAAPAAFSPPGYAIVAELGQGGMGVVYSARDLTRGGMVALKTLLRASPAALARFKREFRTLAGVSHPNLVPLYELVADGGVCFFTMELVDGLDLRAFVNGRPDTREGGDTDFARTRACVGQLAAAVRALHAAGVIHRDVKPSNVLVRPDGRLVLLDFGLAAEVDSGGSYQSSSGQVVGTVAYMAPEQAVGEALTPAADWYAVGVVLYELLTGRLPFDGSPFAVLRDKQVKDPAPPSELRAGVPADLEQLCLDLLARDPSGRPTGADVLRRLGVRPEGGVEHSRSGGDAPLIGRDDHLLALERALAAVRSGAAVYARVCGPSGSGKSSLARAFLKSAASGGAVCLAGRCYEQELVPFKGFDEVVDALSRHLVGLPQVEAAAILPRDVGPLVRLFPALARVPAVATAPSGRDAPDPREARRRGVAALRELIARLADRRPVVLLVDDIQWSDADGRFLIDELLRPPEPPALMLVLCYRSEDADSPALQSVRRLASAPPEVQVVDLMVGALSPAEARQLAGRILSTLEPGQAERIAQESGGNPFFIGELAEAARSGRTVAQEPSLEHLVWERVGGMPMDARRLLEVVAIAGRPVNRTVAHRAAGPDGNWQSAEACLKAGRLLRGAGENRVAPYHDRVRETVCANVPPADRRQHHLRLAHAAETEREADPEFLAVHYHGAGEHSAAAGHYVTAGRAAARVLAFDQAAELLGVAADLGNWNPGTRARLKAEQAEALANAGRGAAAAEAFLVAAAQSETEERGEWQRCAAEQHLTAGHIDIGVGELRQAVAACGLSFPKSIFQAALGVVWKRFRLRIRGLHFESRTPEQVGPNDLRTIDTCTSASSGLSVTNVIYGAYFQIEGLLLSLAAGEPSRVARALAFEGAHRATEPGGNKASVRLLAAAEAIAETSTPFVKAVTILCRGIREYLRGCYRPAIHFFREAETRLLHVPTGRNWELNIARSWQMWSLAYLGEFKLMSSQIHDWVRNARLRNDIVAEANLLACSLGYVLLATDRPCQAQEELRAVTAKWSQQGFHVQHHSILYTVVNVFLYQSAGRAAWDSVRNAEGEYRRAMLWRVQQIRVDFLQLRARSAIAAARRADELRLLRLAERDARTLSRESAPWGQALGALIRACVHASQSGASGSKLFASAADRLEAADLGVYAAAARFRQGEFTDGDEGKRLRETAAAWLSERGVVNPLRMIRSHAPLATDPPE